MLPDARQAWLDAQQAGWGDPARLHRPGRLAAQALDQAREVVAAAVGARPDEVVFTASAAHSNHAAIAGLALGRRRVGSQVVTTAIDHSSVLAAAGEAGSHTAVEVDHEGHVDLDRWTAAVGTAGTAAACIQAANHEVGTLQPFMEAAEICQRADVPLVLDATAALGGSSWPMRGWSVLTGWAGAFGGPASVGILVIKKNARWRAPTPPTTTREAVGQACLTFRRSTQGRSPSTAGYGRAPPSGSTSISSLTNSVLESRSKCRM
jgi:cysteine desulfurase